MVENVHAFQTEEATSCNSVDVVGRIIHWKKHREMAIS